ncbi:MAG: class I SAM-dependent methyltransferase, partial [Nitrospiraceae bacterium]
MTRELSAAEVANEERRIKLAYDSQQPRNYYSWFTPGNVFVVQERERRLLRLLKARGVHSLEDKRILDFGCGSGHWVREFVRWGAQPENITGIDLILPRIKIATDLCPRGVTLQCMNGAMLDFHGESFDLVLQSLVFTSVLDESMKYRMAQEML